MSTSTGASRILFARFGKPQKEATKNLRIWNFQEKCKSRGAVAKTAPESGWTPAIDQKYQSWKEILIGGAHVVMAKLGRCRRDVFVLPMQSLFDYNRFRMVGYKRALSRELPSGFLHQLWRWDFHWFSWIFSGGSTLGWCTTCHWAGTKEQCFCCDVNKDTVLYIYTLYYREYHWQLSGFLQTKQYNIV